MDRANETVRRLLTVESSSSVLQRIMTYTNEGKDIDSQIEENELQAAFESKKGSIEDEIKREWRSLVPRLSKESLETVDRLIKLNLDLKREEAELESEKAMLQKTRLDSLAQLYDKYRSEFPGHSGSRQPPAPSPLQASSDEHRLSSAPGHPQINGNNTTTNGSLITINRGNVRKDKQTATTSTLITQSPKSRVAVQNGMQSRKQDSPKDLDTATPTSATALTSAPAPTSVLVHTPTTARAREPLGSSTSSTKNKRKAEDPPGGFKEQQAKRLNTGPKTTQAVEPFSSSRRHAYQKSQAGAKTMSFDEVFQGGNAKYKHIIVEFPPNSTKWYILKCDEHGVHFGKHPIAGAAKHLHSSAHGHLPKLHKTAIEYLGHEVVDCSPELAERNNSVTTKAFEGTYVPFNANKSVRERESLGMDSPLGHQKGPIKRKSDVLFGLDTPPSSSRGPAGANGVTNTTANSAAKTKPPKPFTGITNPVAGELYLGFWRNDRTKYPVMVLPWGDLSICRRRGTLVNSPLSPSTPKCYTAVVVDQKTQKKEIKGWAKGYEDGGPLVTGREFPVMFFDAASSDDGSFSWLQAKHLSPFPFDIADPRSIPRFNTAREHYAHVKGYASYAEMKAKKAAIHRNDDIAGTAQEASTDADEQPNRRKAQLTDGTKATEHRSGLANPIAPGAYMSIPAIGSDAVEKTMIDASAQDSSGSESRPDKLPGRASLAHGTSGRTSTEVEAIVSVRASTTTLKPTAASESAPNGAIPTGATSNGISTIQSKLQESRYPQSQYKELGESTPVGMGMLEAQRLAAQALSTVASQQNLGIGHLSSPAGTTQIRGDAQLPKTRENAVSRAGAAGSQSLLQSERQAVDAAPRPSPPPSSSIAISNGAGQPSSNGVHDLAEEQAQAIRKLTQTTIQARSASARSASTTPAPVLGSNTPSRGPTPAAVVHGEDPMSRWRAVRTDSLSLAAQTRPLSRSPMGTASPDTSSRKGSLSGSAMDVKSEPTADKEEFYDLVAYSDHKGLTWERTGPSLRLTVNSATKVAETGPVEAIAVIIDPQRWSHIVVDTVDKMSGKTVVQLRAAAGREIAELTFDEITSSTGEKANGAVQARRFCRWMKSVHPAIGYQNKSTDPSRRFNTMSNNTTPVPVE